MLSYLSSQSCKDSHRCLIEKSGINKNRSCMRSGRDSFIFPIIASADSAPKSIGSIALITIAAGVYRAIISNSSLLVSVPTELYYRPLQCGMLFSGFDPGNSYLVRTCIYQKRKRGILNDEV